VGEPHRIPETPRGFSAILGGVSQRLDDIDLQILDALQVDARTSFVRLAESLGVSDTTVRARIDRLVRRFGVRFVVDIHPKEPGMPYFLPEIASARPAKTPACALNSDASGSTPMRSALYCYLLSQRLACSWGTGVTAHYRRAHRERDSAFQQSRARPGRPATLSAPQDPGRR